jgi:hypothetical protein
MTARSYSSSLIETVTRHFGAVSAGCFGSAASGLEGINVNLLWLPFQDYQIKSKAISGDCSISVRNDADTLEGARRGFASTLRINYRQRMETS